MRFNFGIDDFLQLFIRDPETNIPGYDTTERWNESVVKNRKIIVMEQGKDFKVTAHPLKKAEGPSVCPILTAQSIAPAY